MSDKPLMYVPTVNGTAFTGMKALGLGRGYAESDAAFVLASDYVALSAKLAAAEARVKDARELLTGANPPLALRKPMMGIVLEISDDAVGKGWFAARDAWLKETT